MASSKLYLVIVVFGAGGFELGGGDGGGAGHSVLQAHQIGGPSTSSGHQNFSWNALAPSNINFCMLEAAVPFQEPTSCLKEAAPWNMASILTTLDVSHDPMYWSKVRAEWNVFTMLVTWDVVQLSKGRSKAAADLKASSKAVTREMSQFSIVWLNEVHS